MALFKSSNPVLTDKVFESSNYINISAEETMTAKGTMNKFGFLMIMVVASASFTWHLYSEDNKGLMTTLMMVGIFGGLILALVMSFKPNLARYIAPAYGILEGLFLGGLSAIVNEMFAKKYPGLVLQAVGLTFGVALAMFLLYSFRIIKVTDKLRSIIISATVGIFLFYLLTMLLGFFGVQMEFMSIENGGLLGIGISLFVVAIAAMNLLLDFDMIERGAMTGAPKYMEWFGAFALLVTIVWLYIEILKLLMRFGSRK